MLFLDLIVPILDISGFSQLKNHKKRRMQGIQRAPWLSNSTQALRIKTTSKRAASLLASM